MRSRVGALVLAGVLAACSPGGGAGPAPTATSSAAETTLPAATLPVTTAPASTASRPTASLPTTALPTSAGAATTMPAFAGTVSPLPPAVRAAMTGVSWRPGCPVALDDLRLLDLSYWDLAGTARTGQLVVHRDHAEGIVTVFGRLFEAAFPIERMELVDAFGGDDDASMAANNTSAFNCRQVAGTSLWSEHAYGRAVDVNPRFNPWVTASRIDPPNGAEYADRSRLRPGMIASGDVVVDAFGAIGWTWGGTFRGTKDYQHFSATGR